MDSTLTPEAAATLAALTAATIEQTYVGSATRCACGCSGKYRDAADPESAKVLARVQRKARLEPTVIQHYTYLDGSEKFVYTTKTQMVAVDSLAKDPGVYDRMRAEQQAEQARVAAENSMGEGI